MGESTPKIRDISEFKKAVAQFVQNMLKIGIEPEIDVQDSVIRIGFTAENFADVLKKMIYKNYTKAKINVEVVPYPPRKVHYIVIRVEP
ncbi:MAG: hypothetical protein QXT13_11395 [Pyrobaculum sp.]